MARLIDDLQARVLDSSVPVADLLRLAKVAASKLGLTDAVAWLDSELNGYEGNVPEYRYLPQRLVYENKLYGWQPMMVADESMRFLQDPRPFSRGIREVEELSKDKSGAIFLSLPPDIEVTLSELTGLNARVQSQISATSLVAILDAVRTRILDWSLELERIGIHGDNLSFTNTEKEAARDNTTTINFHGAVANIAGAVGATTGNVQVHAEQTNSTSVVKTRIRALAQLLREGASATDGDEANHVTDIADDLDDIASAQPIRTERLHRILRTARAFVPKLVAWAGRAAAEAEISKLLGAG
jgi:hypothetical protein